ncbi:COPII coat complex component Sec31C [Carpediemonas membranifera]|uniref:COPII coat complex component Sec31C n=1 Tax=Carpediemonas membranifera TaxID=201153 RepID=A0A8J6B5T4_9EUKA|nr:COPII coat complex component Sec31C [Carpediemonas membranifera]|eukprot:KAG9393452.1 COPII coat complex component Sec31C [Carpediemonas membranifera]
MKEGFSGPVAVRVLEDITDDFISENKLVVKEHGGKTYHLDGSTETAEYLGSFPHEHKDNAVIAHGVYNGESFVVIGSDRTIDVYKIGAELPESPYKTFLLPEGHELSSLAWNEKAGFIIGAGLTNGKIFVLDLRAADSTAKVSFAAASAPITAMRWERAVATIIAATTGDNTIRFHDLRTKTTDKTIAQQQTPEPITSLDWSRVDPRFLAVLAGTEIHLMFNSNLTEVRAATAIAACDLVNLLPRLKPIMPNYTRSAAGIVEGASLPAIAPESVPSTPAWHQPRKAGIVFGPSGEVAAVFGRTLRIGTMEAIEGVPAMAAGLIDCIELPDGQRAEVVRQRAADAEDALSRRFYSVLTALGSDNARAEMISLLGVNPAHIPAAETPEAPAVVVPEPEAEPVDEMDFFNSRDAELTNEEEASTPESAITPVDVEPEKAPSEHSIEWESISALLHAGRIPEAIDLCIAENRLADAFFVARYGGNDLLAKVEAAFLGARGHPCLTMLRAVSENDLRTYVSESAPACWTETLAAILTYTKGVEEVRGLAAALFDRVRDDSTLAEEDRMLAMLTTAMCSGSADLVAVALKPTIPGFDPSLMYALVEQIIFFAKARSVTLTGSGIAARTLERFARVLKATNAGEAAEKVLAIAGPVQQPPKQPARTVPAPTTTTFQPAPVASFQPAPAPVGNHFQPTPVPSYQPTPATFIPPGNYTPSPNENTGPAAPPPPAPVPTKPRVSRIQGFVPTPGTTPAAPVEESFVPAPVPTPAPVARPAPAKAPVDPARQALLGRVEAAMAQFKSHSASTNGKNVVCPLTETPIAGLTDADLERVEHLIQAVMGGDIENAKSIASSPTFKLPKKITVVAWLRHANQ